MSVGRWRKRWMPARRLVTTTQTRALFRRSVLFIITVIEETRTSLWRSLIVSHRFSGGSRAVFTRSSSRHLVTAASFNLKFENQLVKARYRREAAGTAATAPPGIAGDAGGEAKGEEAGLNGTGLETANTKRGKQRGRSVRQGVAGGDADRAGASGDMPATGAATGDTTVTIRVLPKPPPTRPQRGGREVGRIPEAAAGQLAALALFGNDKSEGTRKPEKGISRNAGYGVGCRCSRRAWKTPAITDQGSGGETASMHDDS
ncbi:hypothetical protein ON010_g8991 [Phytophthora cinnamomi]|nr:hypothetical protein ON010_g8991 [Phytophthora cinnamomi]